MVQIEWTTRSKNDLKNIADYIAKGSKHYAKEEVLKIKNRVNILTTYKGIGRIVPETNRKDIRELIQGNYRIIYKIVSFTQIDILTIHHSSRLLKKENFNEQKS